MAGRPRTRAKRAAQQADAEANPATAPPSPAPRKQESRRRARNAAPKRGNSKAKAKGTGKKKGTGKRGPARPRFEPANAADYEAYGKALDKAAAQAENREPMTAEQRVERDEGIVSAWALGLTPRTIAERVGLSPDQVRAIIDTHRARRTTIPIPSSSELLWDTLDQVEAQIERVSLLASATKTDAVKLGCVRTLMELLESRAGLWQVMGLVGQRPSDEMRAQRARDMLRRLLDVLRELGVSQEALDEAARRVLEPAAEPGTVVTLEGRAR